MGQRPETFSERARVRAACDFIPVSHRRDDATTFLGCPRYALRELSAITAIQMKKKRTQVSAYRRRRGLPRAPIVAKYTAYSILGERWHYFCCLYWRDEPAFTD